MKAFIGILALEWGWVTYNHIHTHTQSTSVSMCVCMMNSADDALRPHTYTQSVEAKKAADDETSTL